MERTISADVEPGNLLGPGFEVGSADGAGEISTRKRRLQGWRGIARAVRANFRLARTGLHLLWGMTTVALAFPFLSVKLQRALKARWSGQLLDALGVRLRFTGSPPSDGMIVANHISWLDVYAINAAAPTAFVSKDDVRHWPLIGWLSSRTETLFIERGNRNAAMRIKDHLTRKLHDGACVALFPEGTTSDGAHVLSFHSALFQATIDAGTRVAPVALHYTDSNDKRSAAPVYIGETTLWQSLCAIVSADGLTAHLSFLPAIDPQGMERRQIAEQARRLIADGMVEAGTETEIDALTANE